MGEDKKLCHLFYEWMMHLYSSLLCIVVHPKCFTIMGGGVSPQPPPVCSIHLDDATAATGQWHQCAHTHTPATGGEEREIEPIKWMGIIRRPWLTIDKGQWWKFGQVTPQLFTKSAMGFVMPTASQDLGLTSYLKYIYFFDSIVSPSLYRGVRTHTDHRVSTHCWFH